MPQGTEGRGIMSKLKSATELKSLQEKVTTEFNKLKERAKFLKTGNE